MLGGTVILIVGIIDDVYQLPAKVKLLGQIAAAAVLVLFDWRMPGGRFHMERDNLIGAKRQNGIGRNA